VKNGRFLHHFVPKGFGKYEALEIKNFLFLILFLVVLLLRCFFLFTSLLNCTMSFKGLRTCIYRVSDVAAATAWYAQMLDIQPYFNEPFYVGFNVGGFELGIQPEEGAILRGENVETYWGVDDIEAAFARLIAHAATPHQTPTNVGDGIWVATAKDPWGNIIGIIQNPHFGH
jgi:lactoylglutathione lyase